MVRYPAMHLTVCLLIYFRREKIRDGRKLPIHASLDKVHGNDKVTNVEDATALDVC